MKVYISNYRDHWISPYTMLEYVFFWTDWSKCHRDKSLASALDENRVWHDHPEWVDRWADYLTPVSRAVKWFLDLVHPKINYVKIDYWDTWSMDSTLSTIVLPMLRQLHKTKHGAPYVDPKDVPEHLRPKKQTKKERENGHTDNTHFERWDWVLGEMIFAFEMKSRDDWASEFHTGEIDIIWVPVDGDGNEVDKKDAKFHEMRRGPKDTSHWDMEGHRRVQERISNGFRLFGNYYEALWD